MHYSTAIAGFLLMVSLTNAAVVQRRTYRNTEEILVPVTIIQDGEEIKDSVDLQENETVSQIKNLATEAIAEDIVAAVEEEEKELQAVEAVVEAERRIDEAVVEEEINTAIQEEQDKEIIKAIEEENKLKTLNPEEPQIVAVVETEAIEEPAAVEQQVETEKSSDIKSIVMEKQTPNQVVVVVETANDDNEQPEGTVRQATQATPTQATTQQNFVQQLIQNSPLGQFFNQITGQTTNQVANDETSPAAPAPTLPGLFNPVTAVQNAAQTVVNSTTQAFQGLQQFASNLGNQFQSTLSGLGGQAQESAANDATTARPPGPIQQFVNTIIGNPQQAQPAPTQQGPLQGLLNIFQGTSRPQTPAAAITNPEPQPAKETETQAQPQAAVSEEAAIVPDQISNEIRDSAEANDSFEDSVQPGELIVVNDDASQTETEHEHDVASVSK